jgi:hypothetical protein
LKLACLHDDELKLNAELCIQNDDDLDADVRSGRRTVGTASARESADERKANA